MNHIFHQQAFHQQCTLKFTVMIIHHFVLSLRLCVYMYTVSWHLRVWSKNSESHNQLICFLPIPEQINAAPGPWNGWGGYWLLITESRHASQANPRNDTSDAEQDECFSVTQQHDLPQDSLHTSTFKYASQTEAHPSSSSAPHPSISITFCGCYLRGYFLTNAKWLCSSMIKVDIFRF